MGFMRGWVFFGAPPLVSGTAGGDEYRLGGVAGARLLAEGVGEEEGTRVGSPLGFKGLKAVAFGSRASAGDE